jgi:hypothetical protein
MPGVIHAKRFFATGGDEKMSKGFVGERKGEHFGSSVRRDVAERSNGGAAAKKKPGRGSPKQSFRLKSHALWDEFDSENPS